MNSLQQSFTLSHFRIIYFCKHKQVQVFSNKDMAQGDVIDYMFGELIKLIGWIINQLFKLALWLIGKGFQLIIWLISSIFNLLSRGVKMLLHKHNE